MAFAHLIGYFLNKINIIQASKISLQYYMNPKLKILIIRNDKLGDFVLAFPALQLLKQAIPNLELHVLVPAYTRPIAEMNPDIDKVVLDTDASQTLIGIRQLVRQIRQERYNAVITFFSTTRTGLACWLSRIPLRIAPATKIAQIFYNHRVRQRRSRSTRPEYIYNTDLACEYLRILQIHTNTDTHAPYLYLSESERTELRRKFYAQHSIPAEHQLIFIHPGSGGSAVNISLTQYAQLANSISCPIPCTFVISCAPHEETQARKLAEQLSVDHIVYLSKEGLRPFVEHINLASLFISGSTGPLHIAGALNRPTAAFYPNLRSATSLRWQTLNTEDRRLAFSPPQGTDVEDMSSIDIAEAAKVISKLLAKLPN